MINTGSLEFSQTGILMQYWSHPRAEPDATGSYALVWSSHSVEVWRKVLPCAKDLRPLAFSPSHTEWASGESRSSSLQSTVQLMLHGAKMNLASDPYPVLPNGIFVCKRNDYYSFKSQSLRMACYAAISKHLWNIRHVPIDCFYWLLNVARVTSLLMLWSNSPIEFQRS